MNERIKELANQMFSMEQFEYAEEFINDEFMEKFAKLIVRECAELFDKNETDIRIPEYQIHDSIMIHFGLY